MGADLRQPAEVISESFLRNVSVVREDRYPIMVSGGITDRWPAELDAVPGLAGCRIWAVTDTTVWAAHGDRFLAANGAGDRVQGVRRLRPGEASKSVRSWLGILDWLAERGARRRDVVLAFGGSVVSDTAGFAAASFMRGIRYVNLPTSLLAQVDGAVGGKVAVNGAAGKNLIGAFHHPSAVLTDPSTLAGLPRVELSNGLAEVIKSFTISPDGRFGELLDRIPACLDGDPVALGWAVRTALAQKMDLVDPDPYEKDLNRVLNFGHTLGHAIEAYGRYRLLRHGLAVAIGIACATRVGLNRGVTEPAAADRILAALDAAELPTTLPPEDAAGVVERLRTIAAVRDGRLRFVIPHRVGEMRFYDDITSDELVKAATG